MDELDKAMTDLAAAVSTWAQLVIILLAVISIASTGSLVTLLFLVYHQVKAKEVAERIVQLKECRETS